MTAAIGGAQPNVVDFWLSVSLPKEGMITVHAETIVFDLLERAGTDAFKTISKLVR